MSRLGKKPVKVIEGVSCLVKNGNISFQGPKGELTLSVPSTIAVSIEADKLSFSPRQNSKRVRSLWGYYRSAASNAVIGVSGGFERVLELSGVGYRAKKEGETLVVTVGFSHPVKIVPPPGITFAVEGDTKIKVSGVDKQKVGEIAAKIRSVRPPEPYKGKGIKYQNEVIRKKAGKAGKVGTAFGAK